jgi:hypothetical protein
MIQTLFNYRPGGTEITVDGETLTVNIIRRNPRFGIIARVRGRGRVVLYTANEADAHMEDTETQLLDRLKEVI